MNVVDAGNYPSKTALVRLTEKEWNVRKKHISPLTFQSGAYGETSEQELVFHLIPTSGDVVLTTEVRKNSPNI